MVAFLLALALAAAPRADTSPAPPDEATVRALVARWLDAQNKGDFPAYRALYAPTFHGIRRSDGRTVVLDHAGWLRDRGRMFKKPMKVTATDVRVTREGGFARAMFVQDFSSAQYRERGGDTGRAQHARAIGVCISLASSAPGRVDVGTLDTATWFCGY